MTNKELHVCTMPKMNRFFREQGIDYIFKSVHPTTQEIFYVYWNTPELRKAETDFNNQTHQMRQLVRKAKQLVAEQTVAEAVEQ